MKIKTLEKLNNVLSYSNFEWAKTNPPTIANNQGTQIPFPSPFVKTNILFGENGNGKSKLVEVLKCVNDSAALPKHHDLESQPQEIKIRLDGLPDLEYATAWSHSDLEKKFLFFDKAFINNTVHSVGPEQGDTPQRKQQRGRDIIYLGNFEQYNAEIEWIDSLRIELRKRSHDQFTQVKIVVDALITSSELTLDDVIAEFAKIDTSKLDLDTLAQSLKEIEAQIAKTEHSIKETDKVLSLKTLAEIKVDFSLLQAEKDSGEKKLDPKSIFEFSLADAVTETLQKIENKKDFVRLGVKLLENEDKNCPFCTQSIETEPAATTVKNYKEIFDQKFSEAEERIMKEIQQYRTLLSRSLGLVTPTGNAATLKELANFTSPLAALEDIGISDEDRKTIEDEISRCLKKTTNPLQTIEDSAVDEVKNVFTRLYTQVATYNAAVTTLNNQINDLRKGATDGTLDAGKTKLEAQAKNFKLKLFITNNKDLLESYQDQLKSKQQNELVIEQLERIFQLLKTKIVDEFKSFASDYFALIATYINRISPAMEILDIQGQPTYDGRSATDPAQCGFKVAYNKRDISGHLSEGEKQVIALAFFFAHLTKEVNKNKIIILDDPITSFDAGKRKATAEVIKEVSEPFDQLFVFTCDPLFRQYLLKALTNRNFYYVLKTAGSSAIHYVPNNKEAIYKTFEDEFATINTQPGTDENIVVFGQKLRFCLETKIREEYFGASEDKLSNMIETVTANQVKFNSLFANKVKILEIYSYCNTGGLAHYPKDGATSWNELKAKIAEYLALAL